MPRLAITLGDPRGIGPEITARILVEDLGAEVTVVGPDDLIASIPAARRVGTGTWDQGAGSDSDRAERIRDAGQHAGSAVERAVALARGGEVDAIVTAPANKAALRAAGYDFPGHTELLRHLTGARHVAMMLASKKLRVALVTTHLALREAIAALSVDAVVTVATVTRSGLRDWFGILEPRLALCAANPHGGEGGLFGKEDDEILAPAAESAQLIGPLPADTVFVRAMRGEFDAVLVPYHDVGMTAIKVASFGEAVNVTLGLPIPRTAPDHGTAFDIAGQGRADPTSMRLAARLAIDLASRAPKM